MISFIFAKTLSLFFSLFFLFLSISTTKHTQFRYQERILPKFNLHIQFLHRVLIYFTLYTLKSLIRERRIKNFYLSQDINIYRGKKRRVSIGARSAPNINTKKILTERRERERENKLLDMRDQSLCAAFFLVLQTIALGAILELVSSSPVAKNNEHFLVPCLRSAWTVFGIRTVEI